jgi:hypothetical protein
MLRRLVSFVSFVAFVPFVSVMSAQTVTQRGFVEGGALLFPEGAPNDPTRAVADLLVREEVFLKPAPWLQFAGGVDLRANSHDQVDARWRLDLDDRGVRRPRASLRRLTATLTQGPFTIDVGRQFIRWGVADLVNPTDRFAPRDFLNVVDAVFLPVTGLRGVAQKGGETFEAVWVPRFTPSRVPLVDQRWTIVPATPVPIVDGGSALPGGSETGVRWGHVGSGYEFSLSFFNGFNHLPNIDVSTTVKAEHAEKIDSAISADSALIVVKRVYPALRTYGADAAVPTRWFILKGEAAYFTSSELRTDEYVLYVLQVERQTGEWVIVAGYAGEAITAHRAALTFAPDRGMTRSLVARVSYTIDANRRVAFENAVRQNGGGVYSKLEYSQASGQHWRATLAGVAISGHSDDFLGQYHRNSHVAVAVRYSF